MKAWLWLGLSLLVAGTVWLYVHRVLNPWAAFTRSRETTLIAEMGDLYSPWVGSRELLLHGRNPYSSEVSHEIQMAFYGHAIDQAYGEPGTKLVNEQRFAYPVYAVFVMAATVHIPFFEVKRWSPLLLGLLTFSSVLLYIDFLRWRPPAVARVAIGIFVLSCPQIVQGLRLEQLALVVGFLLALGAWCVGKNRLVIAGVILAFSTIKPQMSLFPLLFFLVWTLGDWGKRWRLLASFLLTLSALIAVGELLLPGWVGYFLAGARAYRRYFPTTSLLRVALGDTLGVILGGIIGLVLLIMMWRNRKEPADSPRFAALLSAFFIGTILAFPLLTPFNQVLLIFPTMLLLYNWCRLPMFSRFVFVAMVVWPSITSGTLLLFPPNVQSLNQLPLLPAVLTVFYPVFLALLLVTLSHPDKSMAGEIQFP